MPFDIRKGHEKMWNTVFRILCDDKSDYKYCKSWLQYRDHKYDGHGMMHNSLLDELVLLVGETINVKI